MPSSKPAAQLGAQAQCGVRGHSWTIAGVKAATGTSARRPGPPLMAISVHSPAEPLVRARLAGINVVKVRPTQKAAICARARSRRCRRPAIKTIKPIKLIKLINPASTSKRT